MSDRKAPVSGTDPITGQKLRIDFEEIETPSHPDAEALLAYWHERRQAGGFVMGRDVPSKAIARLTKHLVVSEPLPDHSDFRYRVVGMVVIQRLGFDVTGMLVSEVFAEEPAQSLIGAERRVLDSDAPVFLRMHVQGVLSEVRWPELVVLPMSSPDQTARWVLVGVFYHDG